jgi:hypothetical protein
MGKEFPSLLPSLSLIYLSLASLSLLGQFRNNPVQTPHFKCYLQKSLVPQISCHLLG